MDVGYSPEQDTEMLRLHSAISEMQVDSSLREQFIATLTHDLKTPLASISLQADIARKETPGSTTAQRMSKIIEQVQRMDRMIQGMLDVSLIRAGRPLPLKRRDCELVQMIRETCEDFALIHQREVKRSGCESVSGVWDIDQLRRVLTNLLHNALKYGSDHDPIQVSTRDRGDTVEVAVTNRGNPIPEDRMPLLFQPYHRSEQALRSGHSGWGLGLTLVKGVIDSHRGTIAVQSDARSGTTFSFVIPKDFTTYLRIRS